MKREKRKFTPEEKLSILQEAQREGITETLRKYHIAPSLYQLWKKKYLTDGIGGLKSKQVKPDPELTALRKENERLRKIIADQVLELEVKEELLKKTPIGPRIK